jgi:hypothetical protein
MRFQFLAAPHHRGVPDNAASRQEEAQYAHRALQATAFRHEHAHSPAGVRARHEVVIERHGGRLVARSVTPPRVDRRRGAPTGSPSWMSRMASANALPIESHAVGRAGLALATRPASSNGEEVVLASARAHVAEAGPMIVLRRVAPATRAQ